MTDRGGIEEAGPGPSSHPDELIAQRDVAATAVAEHARYMAGARYMAYDVVTSLALGLLAAVVVARVFGSEVVGAFALASLLTGAFGLVANVRQQGGLVRDLTRHAPRSREARALLWVTLAFTVGLTALLVAPLAALGVLLLRNTFDQPDLVAPFLILVGAYTVVDAPAITLEAPLAAYRDGRSVWLARTGTVAALVIGASVCWIADATTVYGIVAATIAASAAGLLVRLWRVRRLLGLRTTRRDLRWAVGRLRWIISFGLRATPSNYSETVIEYADSAILAANVALSPLGAYNRAYQVYRRVNVIPMSLSQLYFPTLCALFLQGAKPAMARVYRLTARYLVLLLLPGATWIAVSSSAIMALFGEGFESAATALAILASVVVVDTYGRLAGAVSAAADKPGRISIVTAIGAAVNVSLCLALIPPFELTGAAVANLIGFSATTLASLWFAAGELGKPLHWMVEGAFVARLASACALMAAALLPLRGVDGSIVWLALAAPPVLALGLLVARPLDRADIAVAGAALQAAGIRSPRLHRWVISAHRAIAHGARPAS